jgi:hypothetical protein
MQRRPRKPERPILSGADTKWFIVAGCVMAAATLAVIAGAEHTHSDALADVGRRDSSSARSWGSSSGSSTPKRSPATNG